MVAIEKQTMMLIYVARNAPNFPYYKKNQGQAYNHSSINAPTIRGLSTTGFSQSYPRQAEVQTVYGASCKWFR
jgi:hypothetical protein